ncbi:MAG: SRPBCC domain-containing protein [Pseudomonadota bacterium]|nr:SRPBCC domain-containing protein [Pseudomonadota bacterium]
MTTDADALTLKIERTIHAPRAVVWRCWTETQLLRQWFCPKPWSVPVADLEVRPGGRMNVTMAGPDGERHDLTGSFLEVVPGRRLVFTDSLAEGYMPLANPFMTGFVELSDNPDGTTRMVWGARHATGESMKQHLDMGFEAGWDAAAKQLDELARATAPQPGATLQMENKVRTCLFLPSGIEAAAAAYTALVPRSRIETVHRPDPCGEALAVEFSLDGAPFLLLAGNPDPVPSLLASICVLTPDQSETDRLWSALLAEGGEAGPCGWLKDRFGVHWQVVPEALPRLMGAGDPVAAGRVQAALMRMHKIDIAALEAAHAGVAA